MKKIIFIFSCFLFIQSIVLANYNEIFIADIQYDWIDKSLIEKNEIISEIKDLIFKEESLPKKENLKSELKEKIKDKNYREHYILASAGVKEDEENYISSFYYKNQKHIYMYALQNKKDLSKKYYYDALGKLRYIDFIEGEYPDYPFTTLQYKTNGTPISAIYNVSKDTQYLYNPDSTFKGVWYKYNLYDEHSKVILKRTFY